MNEEEATERAIDQLDDLFSFVDRVAEGGDVIDDEWEPCPMGCGGLTEDPYGGPCDRCWEKAYREQR